MTDPRYGAIAEIDQIRAQARHQPRRPPLRFERRHDCVRGHQTAAFSSLFTHLARDLGITTQRQGDGVAMLIEAGLRLVSQTGPAESPDPPRIGE